MSTVLIGEINPKKKKKAKKKKATKKRAKPKEKIKYRYRDKPKKKTTKRRTQKGARLNPVEGDIIKTIKDTLIMAGGAVAGYVAADYMAKKVEYIGEHANVAKPAVMAVAGLTLPSVLKGKNKPLATKLSYGMLTAAALYVAMPWLAEKLPGLREAPLPGGEGVTGYYRAGALGAYYRSGTMGAYMRARSPLGAYYGDSGVMTPAHLRGMGAFAMLPGSQ